MPLQLPNLDDRRYQDLLAAGRAMLPGAAPEWTDHNAADPGITLVELFAYIADMLLYRLNRVSERNTLQFVKLMRGPDWVRDATRTLDQEVREAVLELRRRERAVTVADYERLALEAAPQQLARACGLPGVGPTSDEPGRLREQAAQVSLVVVPQAQSAGPPIPDQALLQAVRDYLEPRRLLTTRVHVMGPRYVSLGVCMDMVPRSDRLEDRVREEALAALTGFLHPLQGGPDGTGWPFGRPVYVSEIYDLLDRLPSVDHVKRPLRDKALTDELVVEATDKQRLLRNAAGELVAVRLTKGELVALNPALMRLSVVPK